MSYSARKLVARHRHKLRQRGLLRVEILVPEQDADNVRQVARVLRAAEPRADEVRQKLAELAQAQEARTSLKELLASAPFESIEIRRRKDLPRNVAI